MTDDTILFNRGAQQVRHVPVDRVGHARVVTSATFTIVDLRVAEGVDRHEVVAETAATVSAVTTTTTAAAGIGTADPRRFPVTADPGFRTGGTYLIQDVSTGREESLRVSVIRGLELTATSALRHAYANGATITALELEGTFPAEVADDEKRLARGGGPFQVTWVYTIGGQLYVSPRDLWLTRYGIQPWVTASEMFQHLPGHAQQIGDSVTPEEAIAGATDDFVEHMLSNAADGKRRDPSYFRGNISADLFIRKQGLMYLLRGMRNAESLDLADRYESKALMHANNLTEGKPPTRTVAVEPIDEKARAGGEQLGSSMFARS